MSLGLFRSVLITAPLIVLATAVFGFASLVVSFFDATGRKQIAVARAWARSLLRLSGVSVSVEGLDRIDPEAGYVVAANHASYMDTPVVLSYIPLQFRFMAKDGLFRIPLLGTHLQRAGHIPVPRANPREALKTMAEAARIIRERRTSVLVFPEGGRSLTGLQPFREGAAYIAIKAGVPIVPVALKGTIDVLPMHSVHVHPGHVVLRIGVPIPTAGLTAHDRGRLTEDVRAQVAAMLEQPGALS
jgi:1-acyl-sn-glycerol-3-phosphate acyltransferase